MADEELPESGRLDTHAHDHPHAGGKPGAGDGGPAEKKKRDRQAKIALLIGAVGAVLTFLIYRKQGSSSSSGAGTATNGTGQPTVTTSGPGGISDPVYVPVLGPPGPKGPAGARGPAGPPGRAPRPPRHHQPRGPQHRPEHPAPMHPTATTRSVVNTPMGHSTAPAARPLKPAKPVMVAGHR